MGLPAGVQPPGLVQLWQEMLQRKVLPSRDVVTHPDRIHAALSALPCEPRRAELEFSIKKLFLKEIQFLRAGEMVSFLQF